MPEKKTLKRARKAKREGKAPSTQAGEFVRETIDNIRQGKHGARSAKQAIAIGLSKARRGGVKIPLPKKGTVSEETRRHAERDAETGKHPGEHTVSRKRSQATTRALKREGQAAASKTALSRQAHRQARQRTPEERSAIGRKAARTRLAHQSPTQRRASARKAARTRSAKNH